MRGAQPLAQWLVANPLNSVLGLALSLLLPFSQVLAGATVTLMVLHLGLVRAALYAGLAAVVVAGLSLLLGSSATVLALNAAVYWIPAGVLAGLLVRTRSLVLTMQLAAVFALAATLLLPLIVGDPIAFWKSQIVDWAAAFEQLEFQQQADTLLAQQDALAPQMTVVVIATIWSLSLLVLALGYWLYQALPERAGAFGRFCDLNLGRVLASLAAVASAAALLSGVSWLQDFAFVGLALFWIQGLAMLHWLRVEGPLPAGALIVVYGLLPILNVLLILGLAALGYSDAWFDYRARAKRSRES